MTPFARRADERPIWATDPITLPGVHVPPLNLRFALIAIPQENPRTPHVLFVDEAEGPPRGIFGVVVMLSKAKHLGGEKMTYDKNSFPSCLRASVPSCLPQPHFQLPTQDSALPAKKKMTEQSQFLQTQKTS